MSTAPAEDLNDRQHRLRLVFASRGDNARCSLHGFPQVELIGPNHPPESYEVVYRLPDSSEAAPEVLVDATHSAEAIVTWLEPTPAANPDIADPYVPGYLRVVATTDDFAIGFPWSFGPVIYMDGSTHPGNFVGPITPFTG